MSDRWILHNLNETIGKSLKTLDKFVPVYQLIWDEFGELTKEVLYSDNEEEKVITSFCSLYTLY